MTYAEAITAVERGQTASRAAWDGAMHVALAEDARANDSGPRPCLFAGGHRVPWLISHADHVAEDWAAT